MCSATHAAQFHPQATEDGGLRVQAVGGPSLDPWNNGDYALDQRGTCKVP